MKRQSGFTIFEIAVVLIILGVLTAGLAPLLIKQHSNSMEEKDKAALDAAKTAIISYAASFGGIPDPAPATSEMPAVPAFDVNNWGAFGTDTTNRFRLDVNDALKSSCINNTAVTGIPCAPVGADTGGDKVVFCQAVNEQLATTGPGPETCQDNFERTTAACASSSPAAFVLYSTGNDRVPNQENNEASVVGTMLNNRIYENDKRGINNGPGESHFDDQVMSYPLSALARDCRERMDVLPEVMRCKPGQKAVVITNTSNEAIYYATTGNSVANNVAFTPVATGGSSSSFCQDRTATVYTSVFANNIGTSIGISPSLSTVAGSNATGKINAAASVRAVTITDANPGIVTWTNHGFTLGQKVIFMHNGDSLPTSLAPSTVYYLVSPITPDSFALSTTSGGVPINTTPPAVPTAACPSAPGSCQTGTHIAASATVSSPAVVTITSFNPGVITWAGHGLTLGSPVIFTTTGALPTDLIQHNTYYVASPVTANAFEVSATPGGAAISTIAGTQSGVHTAVAPVVPAISLY